MSPSVGGVENNGSDQDCKDESAGLRPHVGRRQSFSSPWRPWSPAPAASDTSKKPTLDDAEAAATGNNEYRPDRADIMDLAETSVSIADMGRSTLLGHANHRGSPKNIDSSRRLWSTPLRKSLSDVSSTKSKPPFQIFATEPDGITPQLTRNTSMPLSSARNPFDVTMNEATGLSQQESSTVQDIWGSTNDSGAHDVVMCEPQLESLSQQVDQVQLMSPLRRDNGARGPIRNRQGVGSSHHPYRRSEITRPAGSGLSSAPAMPPRLARAASFSVHSQRPPAMLRREASTTALMDTL
ncbi:hypothetical protein BG011_000713 [Mortierella polycephala]|uniref:Uncharacterized protein n=1 Tax=Mortierella polycephala TaxID=41804 RepID=A0A9P6QB02_9FUNG|nr:hypothetical protein BG011_000713 [Mortierella polycephala]